MNEHDPFDLEGQETRRELASEAQRLQDQALDDDVVWLMSGPRGRRLAAWLLSVYPIESRAFEPSCPNAQIVAYREGQKDLGRYLLKLINRLCPDAFHVMMQERNDARTVVNSRNDTPII